MFSFTLPVNGDGGGVAVATEVESSACEKQCSSEQQKLVTCVDSIRESRTSATDSDGNSTATATPPCLPLAVAAWTKCCQEATTMANGSHS
mmetsp:Transcript_6527/g.14777  ORF Transcript_6527/g.14777 Transcript_6527/m.14777 type:complete len:91 (+) Transcript_6527:49-321(+)